MTDPPPAPFGRPSFSEFLEQVAHLTDTEARELAEIERVTDWSTDRNPATLFDQEWVGMEFGEQMRRATREARRLVGDAALADGRMRAAEALARRAPTWRRMGWHRPLTVAFWIAACLYVPVAIVPIVLGGAAANDAALYACIGLTTVAAVAALGKHLLPPSLGDLRKVVDHAAMAHIAGASLGDAHFWRLAGGWYAVRAGEWRRGRRPYRAWGCLIASIVALVALGIVLQVTGLGR